MALVSCQPDREPDLFNAFMIENGTVLTSALKKGCMYCPKCPTQLLKIFISFLMKLITQAMTFVTDLHSV